MKELVIKKIPPEYDDFHTRKERHYLVLLDAGMEIETTNIGKSVFDAGEVLSLEDHAGKGHRIRNIGPGSNSSFFVTS